MKKLHKALFLMTLLAISNVEARKQAGFTPEPAKSSWIGSLAKGAWSSVKGLFGSSDSASTMGKVLPVAGTVAAAAILPFGLGTVLKIAAPYAIGAAAKLLTDKVTGRDAEREKKEQMIREVAKRVARSMSRPRRGRSRSRRPMFRPRYYDSYEYDEGMDYGYDDDYGYDY